MQLPYQAPGGRPGPGQCQVNIGAASPGEDTMEPKPHVPLSPGLRLEAAPIPAASGGHSPPLQGHSAPRSPWTWRPAQPLAPSPPGPRPPAASWSSRSCKVPPRGQLPAPHPLPAVSPIIWLCVCCSPLPASHVGQIPLCWDPGYNII